MPRCNICKTQFFAQSWLSPAEDCDCGSNLSGSRYRELDEYKLQEVEAKRREWNAGTPDTKVIVYDGFAYDVPGDYMFTDPDDLGNYPSRFVTAEVETWLPDPVLKAIAENDLNAGEQ